jgi:hypothetical protein
MNRTPSPTRRPAPKVLSQYARNVLAAIADEPKAAEDVNPGLKDRLQERGFVEITLLPHPTRAKQAPFLKVTAAGREEIARLMG